MKPCTLQTGATGKRDARVTDLLVNRQIHAEHRQTHVHTARRLESMQAVQHESQWRLPFEPSTQSLTLHWIRIRRGDLLFDHTFLDRVRFLQREEGLDQAVWKEENDNASLAEAAREILSGTTDLVERIERTLRLVQDQYRYLSVNLDLGGHF